MSDAAREIISAYESGQLRLATDEHPDAVVVHLSGYLSLGEGTRVFNEKIKELAARSDLKKIILDLAGVSYVDSSGLGSLVTANTRLRNAGIRLLLASPSQKMHDTLQVSRLFTVFPVTKTVEEALADSV